MSSSVDLITKGVAALSISPIPNTKKEEKVLLLEPFVAGLQATELTEKLRRQIEYMVCKIARAAIHDLLNGRLTSFDALASDTACQVRATKVAVLANAARKSPALKSMLEQCLQGLNESLQKVQRLISRLAQEGYGKNAPQAHEASPVPQLLVSTDVRFLAMAYLLEKTTCIQRTKKFEVTCADCGSNVAPARRLTDGTKMASLQKGISGKVADRIMEAVKTQLTREGIEFLQRESGITELLLAQNIRRTGIFQNRTEVPCLFSLQAMYRISLGHEIPILLRVQKTAHHHSQPDDPEPDVQLLYKQRPLHEALQMPREVSSILEAYDGFHPTEEMQKEDRNAPLIVIDAQRCGKEIALEKREAYVERLKSVSLVDLLEMNGATHKQYSDGVDLEGIQFCDPTTKARMLAERARALEVGASHEKQTLLSITHIFPGTLNNCDTSLSRPTGGKK